MSGKQRLSTNIFSSAAVNLSKVFLQLFVTPLIIHLLGSEQYGLLAFAVTVQSFFFVLDLAIGPVVIREFGVLNHQENNSEAYWKTFLTFERCAIILGAACGLVVAVAARWISQNWIKADALSPEFIKNAIRLIGLLMMFQWPVMFYVSCFVGMQRQFSMATTTTTVMVVQTIFVLSALKFFHGNVFYVLGIQCLSFIVNIFVLRKRIVSMLPAISQRPKVDFGFLAKFKRFAGGTFLIGITIAVLTQVDKLFISKFVKLEAFSAYSVSFNVIVQVCIIVTGPLMATLQPVLAGLVAKNDTAMTAEEYHRFSQFNAILVFSFLGPFLFFSDTLFALWLGPNSPLLPTVLELVPWVTVGCMFNVINSMPYSFQLAAGWTRLKLTMNVVQVILYVILLVILFPRYGMIVGPWLWIGLNALNTFVEAPIFHRYLVKGEYFRWLLGSVVRPAIISMAIFFVGTRYLPSSENLWISLLRAIAISLCVLITLVLTLPRGKALIFSTLKRLPLLRGIIR